MTTHLSRLAACRANLERQSLDGFIVPLTDEHMSEYVGAYAQRLSWLTGFEGSAGNAVILKDKAAIFVDGRYTLQVKDQVDLSLVEAHHFEEYPLLRWVKDNAKPGDRIGYDAELTTVGWQKEANDTLESADVELVVVDQNPIDEVWTDQPGAPMALVIAHNEEYAGISAATKRVDIASELNDKGADAAVITMLDSVAWAFNIRGSDVENTPVPHAFAVLNADESAVLFIDDAKVDHDLRAHLGNSVEVKPRASFYSHLSELAQAGKTILVDPASNNAKVFETLKSVNATIIEGEDPCILRKAVKNATEQAGARTAHIRDGAAISDFLYWLSIEAPTGNVDELIAVDKLWSFRMRQGMLKDKSFDTISGAGPNGAIVHYRVSERTNRKLEINQIYLVDSGGQYLDGTTDITRTIIVGTPTGEMKDRFTRVLKGHIALSMTKFPKGTSGHAIDAIARRPLWSAGLDYDHGTGHGVGSFLAVHEGPQRIAKFGTSVALKPGMILSNEPGYYKAGEYGIRIENLVLVRPVDVNAGADNEREMYEFENLTWAPIDKNLIDIALLSDEELDWLNAYHASVLEKVGDLVLDETRPWLTDATSPITR